MRKKLYESCSKVKQRFATRKLKVGLVSVLLGFSLVFGGNAVVGQYLLDSTTFVAYGETQKNVDWVKKYDWLSGGYQKWLLGSATYIDPKNDAYLGRMSSNFIDLRLDSDDGFTQNWTMIINRDKPNISENGFITYTRNPRIAIAITPDLEVEGDFNFILANKLGQDETDESEALYSVKISPNIKTNNSDFYSGPNFDLGRPYVNRIRNFQHFNKLEDSSGFMDRWDGTIQALDWGKPKNKQELYVYKDPALKAGKMYYQYTDTTAREHDIKDVPGGQDYYSWLHDIVVGNTQDLYVFNYDTKHSRDAQIKLQFKTKRKNKELLDKIDKGETPYSGVVGAVMSYDHNITINYVNFLNHEFTKKDKPDIENILNPEVKPATIKAVNANDNAFAAIRNPQDKASSSFYRLGIVDMDTKATRVDIMDSSGNLYTTLTNLTDKFYGPNATNGYFSSYAGTGKAVVSNPLIEEGNHIDKNPLNNKWLIARTYVGDKYEDSKPFWYSLDGGKPNVDTTITKTPDIIPYSSNMGFDNSKQGYFNSEYPDLRINNVDPNASTLKVVDETGSNFVQLSRTGENFVREDGKTVKTTRNGDGSLTVDLSLTKEEKEKFQDKKIKVIASNKSGSKESSAKDYDIVAKAPVLEKLDGEQAKKIKVVVNNEDAKSIDFTVTKNKAIRDDNNKVVAVEPEIEGMFSLVKEDDGWKAPEGYTVEDNNDGTLTLTVDSPLTNKVISSNLIDIHNNASLTSNQLSYGVQLPSISPVKNPESLSPEEKEIIKKRVVFANSQLGTGDGTYATAEGVEINVEENGKVVINSNGSISTLEATDVVRQGEDPSITTTEEGNIIVTNRDEGTDLLKVEIPTAEGGVDTLTFTNVGGNLDKFGKLPKGYSVKFDGGSVTITPDESTKEKINGQTIKATEVMPNTVVDDEFSTTKVYGTSKVNKNPVEKKPSIAGVNGSVEDVDHNSRFNKTYSNIKVGNIDPNANKIEIKDEDGTKVTLKRNESGEFEVENNQDYSITNEKTGDEVTSLTLVPNEEAKKKIDGENIVAIQTNTEDESHTEMSSDPKRYDVSVQVPVVETLPSVESSLLVVEPNQLQKDIKKITLVFGKTNTPQNEEDSTTVVLTKEDSGAWTVDENNRTSFSAIEEGGKVKVTVNNPKALDGMKVVAKGEDKNGNVSDFSQSGAGISTKTESEKTIVKEPEKTQVINKGKLTNEEKNKVSEAVKKANKDNFPPNTKVEVKDNGDVVITYGDESKNTSLTGDKTVTQIALTADGKNLGELPVEVEVTTGDNKVGFESNKIGKDGFEIEAGNPTNNVTGLTVGADGKVTGTPVVSNWNENEKEREFEIPVTVKFPNDTPVEIKITGKVTRTLEKDGEIKGITPVGVIDKTKLTKEEKETVISKIKEENPKVTGVEISDNGTVTKLTFEDGSTKENPAELTGDKTVTQIALTAEGKNLGELPVGVEVTAGDNKVGFSSNKIGKDGFEIEAGEPTNNVTGLTVGADGKVTGTPVVSNWGENEKERAFEIPVTVKFPNDEAVTVKVTGKVTRTLEKDGEIKGITPVGVIDKTKLTKEEKETVISKIKEENPKVTGVEISDNGTVTKLTFEDGSTKENPAELTADKTVTQIALTAEGKNLGELPVGVEVTEGDNKVGFSSNKIGKDSFEIEAGNPTNNVTGLTVGADGKVTGTPAVSDWNENEKERAFEIPVTVKFPNDESVTVKITGKVTRTLEKDGEIKGITPVGVIDKTKLTKEEQETVISKIKEENPKVTGVEISDNGTVTKLTFEDGSTKENPAELTGDKTVTQIALTAEGKNLGELLVGVEVTAGDNKVGFESNKIGKDGFEIEAGEPTNNVTGLTVGADGKVTGTPVVSNWGENEKERQFEIPVTVKFPNDTPVEIKITGKVTRTLEKDGEIKGITPVGVIDKTKLTKEEKETVINKIKEANPKVTGVEISDNGTVTKLTFEDGSTKENPAELTGDKTVTQIALTAEGKNLGELPVGVEVTSGDNKVGFESNKIGKDGFEIEAGNPTNNVTGLAVGADGKVTGTPTVSDWLENEKERQFEIPVTVKFPNDEAVTVKVTGKVTRTLEKDGEIKGITPVGVIDKTKLTKEEKETVINKIKEANPKVTGVEISDNGTATKLTFEDGSTKENPEELTGDKTVTQIALTAEGKNLGELPVGVEVTAGDNKVGFSSNKIGKDGFEIEAGEPTNNVTGLTVGADGKVTGTPVVSNWGENEKEREFEIPVTVKFPNDKAVTVKVTGKVTRTLEKDGEIKGITPVGVIDKTKLTKEEKETVISKIKEENPKVTGVEISDNGTVTKLTFEDGSTKENPEELTGDKTVTQIALTAEGKNLGELPAGVEVTTGDNKVGFESNKIGKDGFEIEAGEPTNNVTGLTVGADGKVTGTPVVSNWRGNEKERDFEIPVTVKFPNDESVTVKVTGKVTRELQKDEKLEIPDKTVVKDPSKLSDEEKDKIIEKIKEKNPKLPEGTNISVDDNGTTTITYPDSSTAVLTPEEVKINPPQRTRVEDDNNLTDAEKEKVREKVKAANPKLPENTVIEVENDGTVKITYPDGSKAILTPDLTVYTTSDAGTSMDQPVDKETQTDDIDGDVDITDFPAGEDNVVIEPEKPTPSTDNPGISQGDNNIGDNTSGEDNKGDTSQIDPSENPNDKGTNTEDEKTEDKATQTDKITAEKPSISVDRSEKVIRVVNNDENADTLVVRLENGDKISFNKTEGGTFVPSKNPSVKDNGDGTFDIVDRHGNTVYVITSSEASAEHPFIIKPSKERDRDLQNKKVNVTAYNSSNPLDKGLTDETVYITDQEVVHDKLNDPIKTPVDDLNKLTDDEKDKVKEEVEKANPQLPDGTVVEVADDGSVTVTYPDGKTDTLSPDKTVVQKEKEEKPSVPSKPSKPSKPAEDDKKPSGEISDGKSDNSNSQKEPDSQKESSDNVQSKVDKKDNSPKTGDTTNLPLGLTGLGIGALGIALGRRKRREK